jgi:hypothetical protein
MAQSHTNNCFIVTRPIAKSGEISVKKWNQFNAQREREKFYRSSFEKFFLNIENKLSPAQHQLCLAILLPSISLLSFHEMADQELELREDFEANATAEQLNDYNIFPDNETASHYVFDLKLKTFRNDLMAEGLNSAIEKQPLFYHLIEKIYFHLPLIFVTTMIETVNYKSK